MEQSVLINRLVRYFSSVDDVIIAYLFGSAARGEQSKYSDIDIGILFVNTLDDASRVLRRIELSHELEELLDHPVDVVDLRETPPHFNHHVLNHKVVVKGRRDPARITFEKDVRRHYFDMLPYRQKYVDARLDSLRGGGTPDGGNRPSAGTLEASRRIYRRLRERTGY